MLSVATPTTDVFHRADSVSTSVLTSKLGMNSTVLAGDFALNDASITTSSTSTRRTTRQNSGSGGQSATAEYGTPIEEPSPVLILSETPEKVEKAKSRPTLTSSASLRLLDSKIFPLKTHITLRKLVLVLRMLILLRMCSLCLQPVSQLTTSFPFINLDSAPSRATNTSIAFRDIPFVAHFVKSPYYEPTTWITFAYDMGLHFFRSVFLIGYDFYLLHKFMLSSETLIVVLLALLVYPLTAWMDGRIHKEFYDHRNHKNIHQLPAWLTTIGKKGFKYIRRLLLIACLWPISHELSREANMVLILCTVWMSVFKRVLKNVVDVMHIRSALRPPNQAFPRGMYFGGFPSGHVSQCFVAMLIVFHVWGLSNLMGIALLAQTLITFVWVVSANRHYLSQVIAGLALGAVYGFAAISWLQRLYGPNTFRAGTGHGWSLFGW